MLCTVQCTYYVEASCALFVNLQVGSQANDVLNKVLAKFDQVEHKSKFVLIIESDTPSS